MIWDQLSLAEKAKVSRERLVEAKTRTALDITNRLRRDAGVELALERFDQISRLIQVIDAISGIHNPDAPMYSTSGLLHRILAIEDGWSS